MNGTRLIVHIRTIHFADDEVSRLQMVPSVYLRSGVYSLQSVAYSWRLNWTGFYMHPAFNRANTVINLCLPVRVTIYTFNAVQQDFSQLHL